jgi:hypothetical protein
LAPALWKIKERWSFVPHVPKLSPKAHAFSRDPWMLWIQVSAKDYSIAKLPMLSALWTKVLYLFRSFLQKENHSM